MRPVGGSKNVLGCPAFVLGERRLAPPLDRRQHERGAAEHFSAPAGTPYTIWLRLKALNNNKFNDSVWAQFSDAQVDGHTVYPINSTSGLLVNLATSASASSLNGWGWQNAAYWLTQATTVTFATSGTHTLRIQIREDGVQVDQVVLSSTTYLNTTPGAVTNDHTILAK